MMLTKEQEGGKVGITLNYLSFVPLAAVEMEFFNTFLQSRLFSIVHKKSSY